MIDPRHLILPRLCAERFTRIDRSRTPTCACACLSRLGAQASEIPRVFQEVQDARSAVRQLLAMLKK